MLVVESTLCARILQDPRHHGTAEIIIVKILQMQTDARRVLVRQDMP